VLGRNPLIPPDELKAILDAVHTWAAHASTLHPASGILHPASCILITTRDTTFNDARFAPSKVCQHIELGGLATEDALELAAAVLDNHSIDRARIPRQALVDLMERLGGHPLSLTLALPALRDHTPAALTARFEELLPGFTTGAAKERNESLAVSLDFSLRRLGDETRAELPKLAVFQGGAMEATLLFITGIPTELWQQARDELVQAALISVDSGASITAKLDNEEQYTGYYLRFHPTLTPHLTQMLANEDRAKLEGRYWQEYHDLASALYRADTQTPHQARAIAVRELPNLTHALDLALESPPVSPSISPPLGGTEGGETGGELYAWQETVVTFATSIAKFLDNFGRWREREEMMRKVESQMANGKWQKANDTGLTKAEFMMMSQQGNALLQQGQAAKAERFFKAMLAKMEAGVAYDADYDFALMYRRMGQAVAAQGRPQQAVAWQRRAVEGFGRISESANQRMSESAKQMMSVAVTDLADNLATTGQFDQAQKQYEAAVDIARESDNQRQVGVALGQLGTLALSWGDLKAARARYTEALETFRALDEPQSEAIAWHQLGRVAQTAAERGSGEWEEAERCYREAVRIREHIRDLPELAKSYNQLAIVAQGAGRLADAERWYLRAQELKDQVAPQNDSTIYNLADLYLSQGRLDEAEAYARRAVAIVETLDLSAEPWKNYALLARIAEARGRADEAASWRRKEQESYAAYAGSSLDIQKWEQEIAVIVAACQGNTQAQALASQIISQYQDSKDWSNLVKVFQRILDGERDLATLGKGLDRIDYAIITTILAQLSGNAAPQGVSGPQSPVTSPQSPVTSPQSPGSGRSPTAPALPQWAPDFVAAVVAAAQGHPQAVEAVNAILPQLEQANWHAMCGAVRRILAGETEMGALQHGLDDQDTAIVHAILAHLSGNAAPQGVSGPQFPVTSPQSPVTSPQSPGSGRSPTAPAEEGITLDQLFGLVAAACGPDAPAGLGEHLFGLTGQLARDAQLPAEFRAVGRVLNGILAGERAPDLDDLPPELAQAVGQLLEQIES